MTDRLVRPDLQPVVISAPFGNYVQPAGATATLGTYTRLRRPGRLRRVIRTVRYYPRLQAWVNRIGLRNPGIEDLTQRIHAGRIDVADKIVSIHGFADEDWAVLLEKVGTVRPLAVELNMSCPNVGEVTWPDDLFRRALGTGVTVIVKLPPVHWHTMAERAIEAGVRWFHACNTLPVPAGGISGKPLKPISLDVVRDLRARESGLGEHLRIIGGGGITAPADIDDYLDAGADHFAIGTRAMNPLCLVTDAPLRPLIEHADRRLAAARSAAHADGV